MWMYLRGMTLMRLTVTIHGLPTEDGLPSAAAVLTADIPDFISLILTVTERRTSLSSFRRKIRAMTYGA
jgi:hypothetical protein